MLRSCLLSLVFLAACSAAPPPQAVTVPPMTTARAPVALALWHPYGGPALAQIDAFIREFSRVHPWITVSVLPKNGEGDLFRQGIAAIALDQPPDLVIASPRTLAEFGRRDALVNLDSYMDDLTVGLKSEDRGDFLPGVLDTGRLPGPNDPVFSLPFHTPAVVLYYNEQMLESAGLQGPPATWDYFAAAARSTTRDNARGWVMSPEAPIFYAFLYSRGTAVLDESQTRVVFNSNAGLEMLQMIKALSLGDSAYLVGSSEAAREEFSQGKAAFWFATTGELQALAAAMGQEQNSFRWGIANVPQSDPSRPATVVIGENVAILRTAQERESAAWLLARWLAAPEQAARWSVTTLGIPIRLSARAAVSAKLPGTLVPLSRSLGETLPTGRAIPTVRDAAAIDQAMVEMWTTVAGNGEPGAAMSRAQMRVNRVLGQTP